MKKKSLLLIFILSVVWLVVSGGPSWGQGTPSVGPQWESVLKVTKTFTSSRDNTLFEFAGVDLSNGAGPAFFAGRTKQAQGSIRRGLIFFDLTDSGIPPNALVTQVTLQLHLSDSNIGTQNVTLHRLVADWGEGNSFSQGAGAVPTAGDATWRHTFFDTAFWTTPGGDFSSTASAGASIGDIGFYSWSSIRMALDVQEWLITPAANFGWILLGNETLAGSAKRFDSRENPTPANRPLLIIEYQPELKNYYLPIIMKQG